MNVRSFGKILVGLAGLTALIAAPWTANAQQNPDPRTQQQYREYQPTGAPAGQPGTGQYNGQPAGNYQPAANGQHTPQNGTYVPPRTGHQPNSGYLPHDPRQPGAPVHGPAPARPVGVAPVRPELKAPFVLTPQQEAELDQILIAWEKQSSTIQTFECTFNGFEYDVNSEAKNSPYRAFVGQIRYSAPDKGFFNISKVMNYNPKTGRCDTEGTIDQLQQWVCDGTSVFFVNHREKRLYEKTLPPEMRGAAIADGPTPFIFGAKAVTLKARYWMKNITPENDPERLWLAAYPRKQELAAEYARVDIILNRKDFMPYAIRKYQPRIVAPGAAVEGGNCEVYQFNDISYNSSIHKIKNWSGSFVKPDVPFTYKLVQLPADGAAPAAGGVPPGPTASRAG